MAVQKEIWLNDIVENLFPENSFYRMSTDDTPFVMNGNRVHIPQSGSVPSVVKNRASVPATIDQRTDTEVNYLLDEYTTDPILVKDSEEMEVSYEKRQAILREHVEALNTTVGDNVAHSWAGTSSASTLLTSGSNFTTTLSGASGTRKKIVLRDIIQLAELMDRQNFPREDRYLLLPSTMYYQLFEISELASWENMGETTLPNASLRRLLDFQVMVRPSVVFYNTSSTPVLRPVGASIGSSDSNAALAWHKSAVCFAQGETELYLNEGVAEYYGDVISAMVRAGSRKRRSGGEGVFSLVQA